MKKETQLLKFCFLFECQLDQYISQYNYETLTTLYPGITHQCILDPNFELYEYISNLSVDKPLSVSKITMIPKILPMSLNVLIRGQITGNFFKNCDDYFIETNADDPILLPRPMFHSFCQRFEEKNKKYVELYFHCLVFYEEINKKYLYNKQSKVYQKKAFVVITEEPCFNLCSHLLLDFYDNFTQIKDPFEYFSHLSRYIKIKENCDTLITISNYFGKEFNYVISLPQQLPMIDLNMKLFFKIFTIDQVFQLIDIIVKGNLYIVISNDFNFLFPIYYFMTVLSHPFDNFLDGYCYLLVSPINSDMINNIREELSQGMPIGFFIYTEYENFDCLKNINNKSMNNSYSIISVFKDSAREIKSSINYYTNVNNAEKKTEICLDRETHTLVKDAAFSKYRAEIEKDYYELATQVRAIGNECNSNESFYNFDSNELFQVYKEIQLKFYKILIAFLLTIDVEIGTISTGDNISMAYQYKCGEEKKENDEILTKIIKQNQLDINQSLLEHNIKDEILTISIFELNNKLPILSQSYAINERVNIHFSIMKYLNKNANPTKKIKFSRYLKKMKSVKEEQKQKTNFALERELLVIREQINILYTYYKIGCYELNDEILIGKLLFCIVYCMFLLNKINPINLNNDFFYLNLIWKNIIKYKGFFKTFNIVLSLYSIALMHNKEFCEYNNSEYKTSFINYLKENHFSSIIARIILPSVNNATFQAKPLRTIPSKLIAMYLFDDEHVHHGIDLIDFDKEKFEFKCNLCHRDLKLKVITKKEDIIYNTIPKPSSLFNNIIKNIAEKPSIFYKIVREESLLSYDTWMNDYYIIYFYGIFLDEYE